jgi:hypothetical protein
LPLKPPTKAVFLLVQFLQHPHPCFRSKFSRRLLTRHSLCIFSSIVFLVRVKPSTQSRATVSRQRRFSPILAAWPAPTTQAGVPRPPRVRSTERELHRSMAGVEEKARWPRCGWP